MKHLYRDYKTLANRLKRLDDLLMQVYLEACREHGKTKANDIRIAMKGLDTARSLLEDDFFKDCPEKASTHVFYGR